MNCRESQNLLQRRLDGARLGDPPGLDQHLCGCQVCRHNHAAAVLMLDGLKALPAEPAPAGLAGRLVASVLRDRQQRRQRMRRRVWVTAGLAAAILLMAWAGNVWLPRHPHPDKSVAVKPDERPAPRPPVEVPQPRIKEPAPEEKATPLKSVEEIRDDVLAVAGLVPRLVGQPARLFAAAAPLEIPSLPGEVRMPMDEPLDPAAQSLRQAGEGVSQGLHTVSSNARRAVDFFVKELPVMEDD